MQSTLLPALAIIALSALSAAPAGAHVFTTHDVGPGDDWCAVIQYDAANGDVVRLAPGDYAGGCLIAKSGIPDEGEPLAVVAAEPGTVRIVGAPGEAVITIVGNYVRLGGLILAPTEGEAAVVAAGRNLLVDGCRFEGGAIGLEAGTLSGGLSLIENHFEDVTTPIAAGCRSSSCDRARGILRDNLFRSARRAAGVAVTVRADGGLEVEGNVVEGSWDTGMELVAGGSLALERNVVLGGQRGLVIEGLEGAEAVLRNNVAVKLSGPAIDTKGLALTVHANTFETLAPRAIVHAGGALDAAGNAVAEAGTAGIPGQVSCPPSAGCWVDPLLGDFRPAPGGPLTAQVAGDATSLPPGGLRRDLCGEPRVDANAAGAFAAGRGAMRLQPVEIAASGCFEAAYIDPALTGHPLRQPPTAELPVGCSGGQAPWQGLLAVGAWLVILRTDRRTHRRTHRRTDRRTDRRTHRRTHRRRAV